MKSLGIQLRVSDLLYAIQKRWRVIVSLTFVGLVFGVMLFGMTYMQSSMQTYQISGSFIISTTNRSGQYINGNSPGSADMNLAKDMIDVVVYVLRSDRLLNQVISDEQMLGVTAGDIRNALSFSQHYSTQIMTMRVIWENDLEGIQIWSSIIEAANALLPETVQIGHLNVINEPAAQLVGMSSGSSKVWMLLPILGFAAGVGFSVIELLMRPTLTNVSDMETLFGLESIGIIPYDAQYFRRKTSMLVDDESSSEVVQNFSSAAYILRNRLGTKEKCHCFYVTSSVGREGRTTVAANLAIQLSDMEHRTLLMDFDYKNPTIGTMFMGSVDYSRSINALYHGEVNENDAIATMTGYLDILPMVLDHNPISLDSVIIEMVDRLREKYEYIIIDAPPVGRESETLSLNQIANTVLFVARYDVPTIPEIQASLEKLDKSGIRVLGCVVNGYISSTSRLLGKDKARLKEEKEREKAQRRKANKRKKKIVEKEREFDEADQPANESVEAANALTQAAREEQSGRKKKRGSADAPAVSAEGQGGAPEAASAPRKEKKAKSGFLGLFSRGEKEEPIREDRERTAGDGGKADPFDSAVTAAKVIQKRHNVLEELSDGGYQPSDGPSDQQVTETLIQMGLEGDVYESGEADGKKDGEGPRKNNIFEDL